MSHLCLRSSFNNLYILKPLKQCFFSFSRPIKAPLFFYLYLAHVSCLINLDCYYNSVLNCLEIRLRLAVRMADDCLVKFETVQKYIAITIVMVTDQFDCMLNHDIDRLSKLWKIGGVTTLLLSY
uniref:Uncharacterized protein n=1 Tax=Micrurus corallinus TaxID=54390 RepID=A0A2D4EUL1_MICCO